MKAINEAATVAAEWWTEKISGNCQHSNGDASLSSMITMCLADRGQEKPNLEQLDTFKAAVIKGIEEYPYSHEIDLYCDYGPGLILRDAANEAGINHLNFPFKTGMFVSANQVRVKDGYGKPYEIIWQKKEK